MAKAFDGVPDNHIFNIRSFEISGMLISWRSCCLPGGCQMVNISKHLLPPKLLTNNGTEGRDLSPWSSSCTDIEDFAPSNTVFHSFCRRHRDTLHVSSVVAYRINCDEKYFHHLYCLWAVQFRITKSTIWSFSCWPPLGKFTLDGAPTAVKLSVTELGLHYSFMLIFSKEASH